MGFFRKLFGLESNEEYLVSKSARGITHIVRLVDGKYYYKCIKACGPVEGTPAFGMPDCKNCINKS